jgi:hypothetical protein
MGYADIPVILSLSKGSYFIQIQRPMEEDDEDFNIFVYYEDKESWDLSHPKCVHAIIRKG